MQSNSWFNDAAKKISWAMGRPAAFLLAMLVIVAWAATGPMFGFNDTWQLAINTGTTIVTFLMVFLIQNTQNRDTAALQIKIDELIRSVEGAHNALLDLEELDDRTMERLRTRYTRLAALARAEIARGGQDTDRPDVGQDDDAFGDPKAGTQKGKGRR